MPGMSAIRPPVPSPLFPTQVSPSPVRSARSEFFRAALEGVRASLEPQASAPAPADTPVRSVAAPQPTTPGRPGALLDIRV